MILASGNHGVRELMKLCQRILVVKGMPEERATSVEILIFKGKGDITNCGMYGGVNTRKILS